MNINDFIVFCNKDWKQMALDWWNNISPLVKKSFIWIFCIVNLVFLWHTITFFFGNHDWLQIKHGIHVGWSTWDGRWGAGVIQQLTGGDILPVWNNLFCFAGFSLAAIFLAKYWDLPKNTFIYVIFGLFIILMPYTLPWLQFVRSETHFWNIFLIVSALILSSNKKFLFQLLAFLILYFCLGCYAAMLSAIFIIFLGRCVIDIWFDNKSLKKIIKERWQTFVVILSSFGFFALTWLLMKSHNVIVPMMTHTEKNVGFNSFINNLLHLPQGIYDSFFYTLPYIPTTFKILLGLAIPAVVYLMQYKSKKSVLLLSSMFLCIIIASQLTNLLSIYDFSNNTRIDFFAMPYVYALSWAILLKTGKFWENFAILFMCIAIFYSGLQDIRDQKVKYFDKLRETKIREDIINRIQINPCFNPNKKYNLIIIGDLENYGETTTFDIYNTSMSYRNAWSPFIMNWNAQEYFNFYNKNEQYTTNFGYNLKTINTEYILNVAAPYPSIHSTFIDKNNVYIIFDNQKLKQLKENIKKQNNIINQ